MSLKTKLFALILLSGSLYFLVSKAGADPVKPKPAVLPYGCTNACIAGEKACESDVAEECAGLSNSAYEACVTNWVDVCLEAGSECLANCG